MNTYPIEEYKDPGNITLLQEIPDMPKKLYISGNKGLLTLRNHTYICIVGSRRYSEYGKLACIELLHALKGYPVVIVSGLNLGLDKIVHETALSLNLPCIAVPASGLNDDVLYPRDNLNLSKQIREQSGLLISEYEPNQRASPWSFPMRNRIMAGLSHATLIIEAEKDSGTLITARLALEYNRDVLAVPGPIFSPTSEGTNSLLKNGAIPICTGEDLLVALRLKEAMLIREASEVEHLLNRCTSEELEILHFLKSPRTRAEIYETYDDTEISKIEIIISMLEVKKLIEERYGKIYRVYVIKDPPIFS
ncbi:MAG: DNA-processing protein DprA [Candidatus Taylorbacteria bacterium]|nr:DNA-processing protein DprA [Candidatus Taylorbacteria bacterium]